MTVPINLHFTVVGETSFNLGHNLDKVSSSRCTIRQARQKLRKQIIKEISKNVSLDLPVIVQWDNKLMPNMQKKSTVNRLPILVYGQDQSQPLSASKVFTSSGNSQTKAVVSTLVDYNLDEIVDRMYFDTTTFSTGRKSGACILIEQIWDRDLLYLAYRHHVLELTAGSAYRKAKEILAGTEIALFVQFREQCKCFDLS